MVEKSTLVKFGKHEHICQLRDQGLLHMKPISYFRQIEDEELRGDRYEGIAGVHRGDSGTATPENDLEHPFIINKWELLLELPQLERMNIFCLCAVRPSMGSFPVDDKNFRFGDYALVLVNPQEFINRISSKLKSLHIDHKADLVEYVSEDYTGEMGPFKKLSRFAYQSEWRLTCSGCSGEDIQIPIGDIKDICIVVKSIEVNQKLSEILNIPLS